MRVTSANLERLIAYESTQVGTEQAARGDRSGPCSDLFFFFFSLFL